jgi:hypothetical protein
MQFRRVVKPQPPSNIETKFPYARVRGNYANWHGSKYQDIPMWLYTIKCPYGQPGDRMWVRESWWQVPEPTLRQLRDGADTWPRPTGPHEERVAYAVDDQIPGRTLGWGDDYREWGWKLKSSIHMPRWASRITLEITDVRVQRVQEISYKDAQAEGCNPPEVRQFSLYGADAVERKKIYDIHAELGFRPVWDSIHGPGAWELNDWVWATSFKVVS